MVVRIVRAVLGSVLLLVGLPLLLAGGVLWFTMQHRDASGAYTAPLAELDTSGYAVVASDVDALLRRDAPFARGGRTTLRVSAQTGGGPAFVGLAPAAEVARYLSGVPHSRVDQVRLARGPLPVALAPVVGAGQPAGPPHEQPFWLLASAAGSLEWAPAELRNQQLALVVMARDGSAPVTVDVVAELRPEWLTSTTFGALVLGAVLVLLAVASLAWPTRPREIVYVVPPAQVPAVAAQLGVAVPAAPLAEHRWSFDPAPGSPPPALPAVAEPPARPIAVSAPPLVWPPPAPSSATAVPIEAPAGPAGSGLSARAPSDLSAASPSRANGAGAVDGAGAANGAGAGAVNGAGAVGGAGAVNGGAVDGPDASHGAGAVAAPSPASVTSA